MTVVIGLVAILATMVYPNINDVTDSAKETVSSLNEKTIQQANIMGDALNNSVPNLSRLSDISDIGSLRDVTVNYTGNNDLYLLVSPDGQSWYSYRDTLNISKDTVLAGKELIAVNITKKEEVKNKGLTPTLFDNLTSTDWNNIVDNSNNLSFAYYAEDSNGNDVTKDESLSITINGDQDSKIINLNGDQSVSEFSGEYNTDLVPTITSANSRITYSSLLSSAYPEYWYVFNDIADNGWIANNRITESPQWIQYKFTNKVAVNKYTITSRNQTSFTNYPVDWQFKGSNDGSNWVVLDERNGQFFGTGDKNSYIFTNDKAYQYYRLYITKCEDDDRVVIGEWEMMRVKE
jgi:type II secretory pathway pseudopilin PulG